MLSKNKMVKAYKAARLAVESTYSGVCTVTEHRSETDEKSSITRSRETVTLEGQPCRVSFERINSAAQSETAAAVTLGAKLFISPDVSIKSGSKIIVEQCGRKAEYCASGEPAVYPTHQEIMLELFKEWT